MSIGGASDRFEAQVIRRRNLLKNLSSRFKPFSSILDRRQGGGSLNKELDFRLWHSGWQGNGSFNKEFDFRSWHCGRQGGQKFTMALCKGKGGEVQTKT